MGDVCLHALLWWTGGRACPLGDMHDTALPLLEKGFHLGRPEAQYSSQGNPRSRVVLPVVPVDILTFPKHLRLLRSGDLCERTEVVWLPE